MVKSQSAIQAEVRRMRSIRRIHFVGIGGIGLWGVGAGVLGPGY